MKKYALTTCIWLSGLTTPTLYINQTSTNLTSNVEESNISPTTIPINQIGENISKRFFSSVKKPSKFLQTKCYDSNGPCLPVIDSNSWLNSINLYLNKASSDVLKLRIFSKTVCRSFVPESPCLSNHQASTECLK